MPLTVFGAQRLAGDIELWGTDGSTGRTFLIKNINTTGSGNVVNASVNSSNGLLPFAVVGNFAYFSATDGSTGQELWRTDGTSAGTTKVTEFSTNNGTAGDTSDDTTGYSPQNIVATSNGLIFFYGSGPAASNPTTTPPRHGIWKYDPVANTTTFVTAADGISSGSLIASGNRIYWTFSSASEGLGTSDGTTTIATLASGSPSALYDAGGTIYFGTGQNAIRKVTGTTVETVTGMNAGAPVGFIHTTSHVYIMNQQTNQLFVTTTATTTASLLTTLDFNTNSGVHTLGFAALGNKLIFSNNKTTATGVGANTGGEIWISDGTVAGTNVLKDIVHGLGNSNPHNFITVGSHVFFQATNGNGSVELWKTDGTTAGTVLVDTLFAGGIDPGSNQLITTLNIENMSVQNGVLFFSFDDKVHGSELWRSDGTAAGTLMVKELHTGFVDQGFGVNSQGASLGASGVFVGWTQAQGYELFVTNGTGLGTGIIADIAPGGGSSLPNQFVSAGTKAYFSAYSPGAGIELWVTDGTGPGTILVKDINPGVAGANPSGMTAIGTKVYFAADNGVNGHELWVTDGTTAGTLMLKDIDTTFAGTFARGGSPSGFVAAGSSVFFTATTFASGRELWVTDGTAAGTHITKEIGAGNIDGNIQSALVSFNNKVYFTAADSGAATKGLELWVSDGTSGGTTIVKDINTTVEGSGTSSSNPADLVVANGKLFFRAQSTGSGSEVYVSDGTAPGTVAVTSTFGNLGTLVAAGNNVFFRGQGASGDELYVTSGSTATLLDIFPGVTGSNAAQSGMVAFGTRVLFSAQSSATSGFELWISDGGPVGSGTFMLKEINSIANQSSNPQNFTVVGSKAYFIANDGVNGSELWVTDGTSGGTQLVRNIGPGSTGGSIQPLRAADDNHLLFLASDGTTGGQELWITDGTNGGTFRVTNVIQPSGGFFPAFGSNLNGGGAPLGNFATVPFTLPAGPTGETFVAAAYAEYFTGLGGADTVHFNSFYTNDDFFDGGTGNDTMTLSGGYTITLGSGSGQNIFNVETIQLLTGAYNITMADIFLSTGQAITFNGSGLLVTEALNFTGSAETGGHFSVIGGSANDNLAGGAGNDTLNGFLGNDGLFGAAGNDTLLGGDGDDHLAGDSGADYLEGGIGNDALVAGTGNDVGLGGFGNDLLFGGDGDDYLEGNDGVDYFEGGIGNDTLVGGAGNDIVFAEIGNDNLLGGDGDDQLNGGDGADYFEGGLNNDALFGGAGNDVALGQDGNDNLFGNDGDDYLEGGIGVDYFEGGIGNDALIAGAGNDIAFGELGNDNLQGGAGDDYLDAGDGADFVDGGDDHDVVLGGNGIDFLDGNGGNDSLSGGFDDDVVFGRIGNDNLIGGDGNDYLDGGDGVDYFEGGNGNDAMEAGAGNDIVFGQVGNDNLLGRDGDDYLDAGDGIDYLEGGIGNDALIAGDGNDIGFGEIGDDNLIGGDGDDYLDGGDGSDYIEGGIGNDVLDGRAGNNVLNGGAGADTFLFNAALGGGNFANIQDFAVGIDKMALDDAIFGLPLGALNPSAFRSGTGAQDADDRIIYDPTSGALLFDADGNGAGAAVQIASLSAGLAISANDFFVA